MTDKPSIHEWIDRDFFQPLLAKMYAMLTASEADHD